MARFMRHPDAPARHPRGALVDVPGGHLEIRTMKNSRTLRAIVLVASGAGMIPSVALADPSSTTVSEQAVELGGRADVGPTTARDHAVTADPQPGQSDADRYASLEAASLDAANFEGGHAGVYIGVGGTLAIVLIVVLIVVLI